MGRTNSAADFYENAGELPAGTAPHLAGVVGARGEDRLVTTPLYNLTDYDLIIDARSPHEYAQDHLPGAVNFPVVDDDEYAQVGILHRTDKMAAYRMGVCFALKNIARYLEDPLLWARRKSRVLVYCFRGGKRSRLWFDALSTVGYHTTRLHGGWKAYRRWVNQQLTVLPSCYRYRVLSGPTGCGKTRLLYALRAAGAQVLDLEDLARHRGSVLGAIPLQVQPSQKIFDSRLLHILSSFSTDQPVWVEAESKKIGQLQLPEHLYAAMHVGQSLLIETEMAQRVLVWREDYRHFEEDPLAMLACLAFLQPLVGGKEFAQWTLLAKNKDVAPLFERLMRQHYDPAYKKSLFRNYCNIDARPCLMLNDVSPAGLAQVARDLLIQFG
ncbi:MAG: tRNA 2-selenouridine(34) synthase MnmH [Ottowia sp.]|nr:tRNA 2-selenouridine(34) synthase MnmH [Ottowia sp.]